MNFSHPIVLIVLVAWRISGVATFSVIRGYSQSWLTCHSSRLFSAGEDEYNEYSEPSLETGDSLMSKRRRPLRRTTDSTPSDERLQEAQKRHLEALKDPTLLTKISFLDRSDISSPTKRAVTEVLGLQQMTEIQAKTYATVLSGRSVLGRARTGTGKTLAFLLPSIERLLCADLDLFKPGFSIGVIIIAPTRELAIQIADQAEALLTFHNNLSVACMYGGTKLQRDVRMLSGPRLPAVLVATPGRLLEHCESTRIGRRKFSDMVEDTRIVILDEADRLLDGFAKETKTILSYFPRSEKRQTLLFSATISKKLQGFIKGSMNIDFEKVDCAGDQDSIGRTNLRVEQSCMSLQSISEYIPTLVAIIQKARQVKDYKILVFFPASKLVRFFVNFFTIGLGIPVGEIHSRMSQASRLRASNTFRSSKNVILFSSDVSARGLDYPEVSLVIQYGAPPSEDSYVHRIGRTGRAGREGQSMTVLLPFERNQLGKLSKRGVQIQTIDDDWLDSKDQREIAENVRSTQLQVRSGHAILTPNAEAASKAFLVYYLSNSGNLDPKVIVEYSTEFAIHTGLLELPPIESKLVARLGLDGLL